MNIESNNNNNNSLQVSSGQIDARKGDQPSLKKRKRQDLYKDDMEMNLVDSNAANSQLLWLKPKSKSKESDRPPSSVNQSMIMNFSNMSLLTADETAIMAKSPQSDAQQEEG